MKIKFVLATLLLTLVSMPSVISSRENDKAVAASRDERVARAAEALRESLVKRRRDFHEHPELSNREERTSRIVAERLRELKFDEVREHVGKYGVVGLLKGKSPGATVAVRADMDALPIQETLNVPYKSQNAGVKHACGHDAHTTIELGVAEVLSNMRDEIRGSVLFIFQPAEEGAPEGEEGGARLMIKEGALANPKPQAIFGLHAQPAIEVGQVWYNSGAALSSAERFSVVIHGKQTHGARPHEGVDAVLVAAEAVNALQSIRSRRIDTQEPLVITVGTIHGGNRFNIVADEVKLEGTIRTLNEDVRMRVHDLMRETLEGVTKTYGATFDLKIEEATIVTYNDPKLVDETLPTFRRLLGDANVIQPRPQMVSEDFSYFQKVTPGFFYWLGVGNKKRGITAGLHTAAFDIDEESLVVGVKVMSGVLLDYLDHHAAASE